MAAFESFEEDHQQTSQPNSDQRTCFCPITRIYRSPFHVGRRHLIPTDPNLDVSTFLLSQLPPPHLAETTVAFIDSATGSRLTYSQLRRFVLSLAAALHHGLGVRKGDVVLILSPNSILYPSICLGVLAAGGVITTANPLNTAAEIAKHISDSGAKLAISAPEEAHKLEAVEIPTLITTRPSGLGGALSVEELIEGGDPLKAPVVGSTQSDVAAVMYSSGTTGGSKGVVLTHGNLISTAVITRWLLDATSPVDDVYLGFLPMFHVYGLAFFVLALPCVGSTTVVMSKFDLEAMVETVKRHQVSNIPAVPSVLLALAKGPVTAAEGGKRGWDLSSLRRVGTGAAPMGVEVGRNFRRRFPWVELRGGYGLTEVSGAATVVTVEKEARERKGTVGKLLPGLEGKVVKVETGTTVGPGEEGELWLRGPGVMKGYLENEEATAEAVDGEGWLRTGDLVYFDEDGYLYIVDRIKELIKHNGFQVLLPSSTYFCPVLITLTN